ncbi:hypothetical protein Lpl7_2799 [Lacticaseibacillus paracasei subsp. tolerans Lpl7]|uniref:Uncharacterized protein n=1 Tax=Lacticaseibacillus paracasei subsp. tolerans Lpl14 TaxID=1256229 RepID=A0A829GRI6_LACPA|nr:DUF1642 domain-containing protein [Lacticaseibacillus paracasei]EPC12609.1 hypothetical protein Lpl7_2799 [Lacticaseibacillus paracasei subsp. tolerans Lpl7]EPC63035.1 hypothetical protein Lpl14_13682 [Lacticaseibacillus paracasei subsp. tolerans Lpl14]
MNEEKLYAVKNDEGKYWDFKNLDVFGGLYNVSRPFTVSEEVAKSVANDHGGHVVTFVEEPEKVVLTKEQAKIVEEARVSDIPATYISERTPSYDEEPLMNAYVNGYTVAKEKKYLVYKELDGKQKNKLFAQAYRSSIYFGTISWILTNEVKSGSWARFAESEIEQYGLQDCEKEEVTDDE